MGMARGASEQKTNKKMALCQTAIVDAPGIRGNLDFLGNRKRGEIEGAETRPITLDVIIPQALSLGYCATTVGG